MEPLPIIVCSLLLGTVRGQGVYAPANARIVHAGQACVVKEDNISERVYTIREGSRLQLVCLVKGHPRPQVKWSKTAGSAADRFQETTVFNETLQIEQILRVQGGRYYCKAENGIGRSAIKSIRVDVQYLDEPLLTVHQSVSDVRGENYYRERTVFLRCTVNSNPPAHFTWKRGSEVVIQKQDEGVDIYEPLYTQGETKVLKLKDLRPQDYANFSCLVSVRNVCDIPDKSTSFMLKNTTAPPLLSLSVPEVLVVDPGEDVEIECSLEAGDPRPSLSWSHSPGPMPANTRIEGGKLWIRDLGPEQAGYYNCSAGNNVGNQAKKWVEIRVRALSNGRFWITPDTFHEDEHIKLDREVKVSCQVDAVPQDELSYTWYKNGKPVKTNHRIIISKNDPEFLPGASSLDIIGMRFSDSATYTCVASLQSRAVPNISIDVNISTTIIPPMIEVSRGLVLVEEGTLAELQCVVSGKPKPLVLWTRLEKELPLPTGEWEAESYDGTLRIQNVTREMSGWYKCRTGRYNGLNVKPREGLVQLDVLFPPTVDPQFEEIRQRLGRAVTLGCRLVSGNPMRVTSVVWLFGGTALDSPAPELQDVWEWRIDRLTHHQYGIYQCILSNQMGSESCFFNLTGRAHMPEFYFDTPSPVRIQKPNFYMFVLQWTQKRPSVVGDVVKYKLEIQEESRSGMWIGPEYISINKTIESGSLISYTLSNLRIPLSYTLHLTPITAFGPGDTAVRTIQYVDPASDPAPSGELLCGFEDELICGFTQDTRDDFDWTRESNTTNNPIKTPNTGPRFDNSGSESGYYMFIEASTPRKPMDRARLLSPLFNVTKTVKFGAKQNVPFCVNFYYHMYGKHVGSLNIVVRTREGKSVDTRVWTLSGNQAEKWQQANVTINPGGPFQVIIEAVRGSGFLGDIGLDDVSITKGSCMKRPFSEKDVIPRGQNAGPRPGPLPLSAFLLLSAMISVQLLLR